MDYRTRAGIPLRIGRVPRAVLDTFMLAHPVPVPPNRMVEVWGGTTEPVPDYASSQYQAAVTDYRLRLAHDESIAIIGAVEILERPSDMGELAELATIGLGAGSPVDYLLYVVLADPADLAAVIDGVFYQSTVTARGMQEALAMFNVTWQGRPVLEWQVKGTPGRRGEVFLHRQAAQYSHHTWPAFCELPGPEQSAIVAFYLADTHLGALCNE